MRKPMTSAERGALKARIDRAKRENVAAARREARETFRVMSDLMRQTSGPCG